jgi:hypothetical protein
MFITSSVSVGLMNGSSRLPLALIVSVLILSIIVGFSGFIEFEKVRIILEYAFTLALLYFAYQQSNYTSLQYEILKKTTQPIIYVRSDSYERIVIENASRFPLFKVIAYGFEHKTNENEHFFDVIDVVYPDSKVVLETPTMWRKTMVADLTITYCLNTHEGKRESIREIVFLDAPKTAKDPAREIETIKEMIPDLTRTSHMIQDLLSRAAEEK